jgi:hypothetical protein
MHDAYPGRCPLDANFQMLGATARRRLAILHGRHLQVLDQVGLSDKLRPG